MTDTYCRFCLRDQAAFNLEIYPDLPACDPCFTRVAYAGSYESRAYLISLAVRYARDRRGSE